MYENLLLNAGGGIISDSSKAQQAGDACVMIGVGGTGLAALRRVKKAVYQHLQPDNPNEPIPHYNRIAFLGIDTDAGDLTRQNPDRTDLQTEEQFSISLPNMTALMNSRETRSNHSYDRLARDIRLEGSEGAGGVRQAGRFCLFKRSMELRIRIRSLIVQVQAASERPNVKIHLFAGLSGGTGSGCFLDTCYIVRDVIEELGIGSTICGYFFLADTQLDRPGIAGSTAIQNYNKRNGYAAFRDLDYCMGLEASGNRFTAHYAQDFDVYTNKSPVDMCHLISGTKADGTRVADSFGYGLGVASEYVLNYLTSIDADADALANDERELTMEGIRIGIGRALGMIRPRVGAERNYHVVGASTAELPLTHIGTYLASRTYAAMSPTLGRHAVQSDVDQLVHDLKLDPDGLLARLMRGASANVNFNPNMQYPNQLNETPDSCLTLVSALGAPVQNCLAAAKGIIKGNSAAHTTALSTYDARQIQSIQDPAFAAEVFRELVRYCTDPEKGPTVAADLLSSTAVKSLNDYLTGVQTHATNQKRYYERNQSLRIQNICDAAAEFNRARTFKKKKFNIYLGTLQAWVTNELNLYVWTELERIVPTLKNLLQEMSSGYFRPLRTMLVNLKETFDANLRWLEGPEHSREESYSWRIFQYDAVRADLDSNVLKTMDAGREHQAFMNFLIENFGEWNTGNEFRTAQCINRYMTERFRETLSTTIDDYLSKAYEVSSPAQLPDQLLSRLLNPAEQRAEPMFWASQTFQMDSSTTVATEILTIPAVSTALTTAAGSKSAVNPGIVVRKSRLGDRITCLRFSSGIPLYAYQGIESLKGPYENSTAPGLHLHERDENWKETLPNPIPYSMQSPGDQRDSAGAAALYEEAVQAGVISNQGPDRRDKYVVRILPNTEELAAGYRKELYEYGGQLNEASLKAAIADLQARRAALLPAAVPEGGGYPLLNDGYADPDHPELDMTGTVRKDYFIRFTGLQRIAADSLAQLRHIDEKLAEMNRWLQEPREFQKKDTLVWTNGMPAAYYAILGGVQTGPLEMTQLKQKAAEGSLKKDTLVWTDGMPAWAAAGTVDALKDLFPAVSPPPVPSAPPVPPVPPVPSEPPMPPM